MKDSIERPTGLDLLSYAMAKFGWEDLRSLKEIFDELRNREYDVDWRAEDFQGELDRVYAILKYL